MRSPRKFFYIFSGVAVMWDTCKGWWEGKIKVEVDEVLPLLENTKILYRCAQAVRYRCGEEPARADLKPEMSPREQNPVTQKVRTGTISYCIGNLLWNE